MALLLGKGEGMCNRVMEVVGECVLYWLGRRKHLLYGLVAVGYWSSILLPCTFPRAVGHSV